MLLIKFLPSFISFGAEHYNKNKHIHTNHDEQHFSENIPSQEFLISSYINVFLLMIIPMFFILFFSMETIACGIQGLCVETTCSC